jgi:hypothetical protein
VIGVTADPQFSEEASALTDLVRSSGLGRASGVERLHVGPGKEGGFVLTAHLAVGPATAGPDAVPAGAEVLATAFCARVADGSPVDLFLAPPHQRKAVRIAGVRYLLAGEREVLYLDRAAAAAGIEVLATLRQTGVFTGKAWAWVYVAAGPDSVRVLGLEDADSLAPDRAAAWGRLVRDLGPAAFDLRPVTVEVGLTRGRDRRLARP